MLQKCKLIMICRTFASAVIESNSSKSKSYLALKVFLVIQIKLNWGYIQGNIGKCSVDGVKFFKIKVIWSLSIMTLFR